MITFVVEKLGLHIGKKRLGANRRLLYKVTTMSTLGYSQEVEGLRLG